VSIEWIRVSANRPEEAHVTLTNILIGLAAWTLISIPVGLILGAVLRHGAAPDPVPVPVRKTRNQKAA
jgi:hypothetical protein